jgi:hypothetical protein
MGGSDHSLKGPDEEVTNGAGEKKDTEAGATTATVLHKEVADGVGEKEVTVASDQSQQGPKSETVTAVDKDATNEKKDTDEGDPSQTEQVGASEHS